VGNSLIISFFRWFFAVAPRNILTIGRNFMRWAWKYFSIGFFAPRLFSPWHKDITGYGRGFDLKRFLHVFGWNLISRIIGAILRIVVMAAGLVAELFFVLSTAAIFVFWYAMPLVALCLFVLGFFTIFR